MEGTPCTAWYGILGPLVVSDDNSPYRIASRLQRLLLSVLLVANNRTVSFGRLADELWGDEQPDDPGGALRTQVSRLRKNLPDRTSLVTDEGGYRLVVDRAKIDSGRFEALYAAATEAGGEYALQLVEDAIAFWRGDALEEFADRPFAQIEARRLDELRAAACELRASLLLATGRLAEGAAAAEALVAERPERELARGVLMEALYRQGRQTEALEHYQSWRRELRDAHGLDPSPALRHLEQQILEQSVNEVDAPMTAASERRIIPRPVTSFVGREGDLDGVLDLLGRARLVTLWGPGGVGKTRLALEAGARSMDDQDGVYLCDLSVLPPRGNVARAVANALGVEEHSPDRLETQLRDRLATAQSLLILDNCEHVLEGVARLTHDLIRSTSAVRVLATSRERLGVDGEHLWELGPLPATGKDSPAVVLFLARAHATDESFDAPPDALETIEDICRQLDGLPLAIELAAARVRGLAPKELLKALDQRFDVLTGGPGTPDRHRSLRAVIDWSYTQLEPVEQRIFDRLSVFHGAFDLEAAEALAVDDTIDAPTVVRAVMRLLDSALIVEHRRAGPRRYNMLDTVRHYGRERLESRHALEEACRRHAQWAVAVAEGAAAGLATEAERESALVIDHRIDELRAAHSWLVGHDSAASLRLVAALRPYALWRGQSEIFRWAEVAAAAASATGSDLLPEVLLAASTGAWQRGDLDAARAAALAANEAARGLGPLAARAAAEASADIALLDGDLGRAAAEFIDAYELASEDGDHLQAVWDIGSAAIALGYGANLDQATQLAVKAFSSAEKSQSPTAAAFAHFAMGEILASEEPERAESHLHQAVELAGVADSRFIAGLAEVTLAGIRVRHQDITTGLSYCESAIKRWQTAGAWTPLWVTLRTVIALLVRVGATPSAAVLYGAAESPRGRPPSFGSDEAMMRDVAERLRRIEGEAEFARHVEQGRSMSSDQIVRFALAALARASK